MAASFDLRRFARDHPGTASLPLVVAGLIASVAWTGTRPPLFDSAGYWVLSHEYSSLGDLFGFTHEVRGYAFPLVVRLARSVLSPFTDDISVVAAVFNVAVVSALVCFVLPALAVAVRPSTRPTVPRILLLALLFWMSWRIDLLYPLSDIPVLSFLALAVLLIVRQRTWWSALGAGLLFGLAYNSRPAVAVAVGAGIVLVLLVERTPRSIAIRTGAALAGALLALAPQVISNLRVHDTFSLQPVASDQLAGLQLKEGLRLERYETFAGNAVVQPQGVRFTNEDLADELGNERAFESTGDWLEFVAGHPLPVASVYGRHLVNGLDARFGGTYVEDFGSGRPLSAVNAIILMTALVVLISRRIRQRTYRWRGPATYVTIVVAATMVPAVLGAVEPRFFIAVHTALISVLALSAGSDDVPQTRAGQAVAVAVVVLGAISFFAIADATIEGERDVWATFNGDQSAATAARNSS